MAKRQVLYDNALGARGTLGARSFIGPEAVLDNNAYTITSTYHGGTATLKCWAIRTPHAKQPVPIWTSPT